MTSGLEALYQNSTFPDALVFDAGVSPLGRGWCATTGGGIIVMMNDTDQAGPDDRPSGRFLLRIPPSLHAVLREAAAEAELSLNAYCARKLASPGENGGGGSAEIVTRAAEQFGPDLLGVLAYGSWARGEVTDDSDVDVMIVVDPAVPIVRGLYRRWDEDPPTWEGRTVEVHVVHPPPEEAPPTALWAEAALDGIVLFERGYDLSRTLTRIRHAIARGAVRRRRVHGSPYWVEAP